MTTVSIDYLNDRAAKALDLEAEIRDAYRILANAEINAADAERCLYQAQRDYNEAEAAAYMDGTIKAMVGEKSNAEQRAAAMAQHLSGFSDDLMHAKIEFATDLRRQASAKATADMLKLIVQTRAQAA